MVNHGPPAPVEAHAAGETAPNLQWERHGAPGEGAERAQCGVARAALPPGRAAGHRHPPRGTGREEDGETQGSAGLGQGKQDKDAGTRF